MKNILYILVAIILIAGVLSFFEKRNAELMEWAGKYEECVWDNYRTTPWEFYNEHEKYPKCDTANY